MWNDVPNGLGVGRGPPTPMPTVKTDAQLSQLAEGVGPLWTVTPGQPGETVRRERSKRSCKQVIDPQAEDRQAKPAR